MFKLILFVTILCYASAAPSPGIVSHHVVAHPVPIVAHPVVPVVKAVPIVPVVRTYHPVVPIVKTVHPVIVHH
ncbi:unnamed protein product [Ceutorhynchus assimilis]|uniref:Uncharacterized protein n=1 Tax=Ceutorhynchus assimilis TaxID=467358 RepID=A0A9N9MIW1_9CUCU|nr:unnamed protein product [Ceutorhynchus assimilis]